jgi:predicted ATPase/DNA-binding XRE family transcriptional regulator
MGQPGWIRLNPRDPLLSFENVAEYTSRERGSQCNTEDAMADESLQPLGSFGELLKYLRQRAGLTQAEFGLAAGYSRAHVARLENNQRQPDVTAVRAKFIEALRLQPNSATTAQLIELAQAAHSRARMVSMQSQDHNLPAPLTSFIGRSRELVELSRLLPSARLLTLTGAGGVGKTRLGLEFAQKLQAKMADGVWLAELASLTDGSLVAQAVMHALGLRDRPEHTPLELLVAYLKKKRLLLIFDNCEHLLSACVELAAALLQSCPGLCILATSREPLRLPGETVWRVPSMTTPNPSQLPALEHMHDYEAIELFVQVATANDPGFVLSADNMASVAHICRRLDGIPLAIEMAAAQASALSAAEIAVGLADCFSLLTGGSFSPLPRHRTLRATMDWSYSLLRQPEQILLARLAVFSGGCTTDAITAICADAHPVPGAFTAPNVQGESILMLLAQLVQKSLVVATQRDAAGSKRYHLLETTRQYALEKLRAQDEVGLMSERHLAWYLALAEETMDLGGHRFDPWLGKIEPEHDNLRAAFAWSREHAGADGGEMMLRVAAALRPYRNRCGFFDEGLAWLEEALVQSDAVKPATLTQALTHARAKALLAQATILEQRNDSLNAVRCAKDGLALFQQVDDALGSAWCLAVMVYEGYDIADPLIVSYAEQSLQLFRHAGCQNGACRALFGLGIATHRENDFDRAQSSYEEAFAIAREIRDPEYMKESLAWMANINAPRAMELCKQEIEIKQRCDDAAGLADWLHVLGRLYFRAKDYDQAAVAIEECVSCLEQGESNTYSALCGIADANNDLGCAEYLRGNYCKAIPPLQKSVRINEEHGTTFDAMRSRVIMAAALIASGQLAPAADLLRLALAFYPSSGHWMEVVWVFGLTAWLERLQGQPLRSARLLGANEALVQRYDLTSRLLYSIGYVDTARAIDETRAALDDVAFETAFAEGQQMSLEQAVQFALAI